MLNIIGNTIFYENNAQRTEEFKRMFPLTKVLEISERI